MTELKKRIFVMLNLTISSLGIADVYDVRETISHTRHVLGGGRLAPSQYVAKQHWLDILKKEVRTIMYLTEISVADMNQVLSDLIEHYQ